jgi:class 3 adenylate cyclase
VSEAGGEVVQAMHGLVLASFASASTCLRLCRGLLPDLRGGVSVGDVLVEAGLLHGLPVVEASRLKDRASPGQLLCLRRLALLTDLPQDAFRDLGELSLEGMSTPVPVWELLRA